MCYLINENFREGLNFLAILVRICSKNHTPELFSIKFFAQNSHQVERKFPSEEVSWDRK